MCSPKLKSARDDMTAYIGRVLKDPTSEEHFRLIDDIAHLHAKISQTQEYRTLAELQPYKHSDKLKQFNKTEGLGKFVEEKRKEWDRACLAVATIEL